MRLSPFIRTIIPIPDDFTGGGGGGGSAVNQLRQKKKKSKHVRGDKATISPAEALVASKHREYNRKAWFYSFVYYLIRLVAGLSAGLLPFVVSSNPKPATALSILVVVATVVDITLNPQDRWKLFSRASDLLALSRLRLSGQYEGYREVLNILAATESANLEHLVSLDELLNKIDKSRSNRAAKAKKKTKAKQTTARLTA
jgi:hypothetical protein